MLAIKRYGSSCCPSRKEWESEPSKESFLKYIKFRGKSWKKTTGLLIDPLYILTKRTKCKPLSLFLAGWKGYSLPVVPSVGRIVNAGGRVQHELSLWNEITSRIEQEMTIYLIIATYHKNNQGSIDPIETVFTALNRRELL